MRLHTQGLTYGEACQLSKELAEAGIDSNIVTGALAINAMGVGDDWTKWDDWDDSRRAEWMAEVLRVVGDRCSLSSQQPLMQRLLMNEPSAKAYVESLTEESWPDDACLSVTKFEPGKEPVQHYV